MYEPITVVKVRKETKITVPAGGWMILCSPDQPLHDHIAKRASLVRDGSVNDDFSVLLIGRIGDTHTPSRFITSEQAKAIETDRKKTDDALAKSIKDAEEREKKAKADVDAKAEEEHKAKVAHLNKQNDAIRNR